MLHSTHLFLLRVEISKKGVFHLGGLFEYIPFFDLGRLQFSVQLLDLILACCDFIAERFDLILGVRQTRLEGFNFGQQLTDAILINVWKNRGIKIDALLNRVKKKTINCVLPDSP